MNFDTATWWLVAIIFGTLISALTFLIKRSLFSRVDTLEKECKEKLKAHDEDIKNIRADYVPKTQFTEELRMCNADIKKIKEDYITKTDFFREQSKTERKLDKIMDILLEMRGTANNE